MSKISRRSFLAKSATTAAVASFSARSWAAVAGANSDIRVATVGFNGQGKSHIDGFRKIPGVRFTALCDVDSTVLDRESSRLKSAGAPIETYTDIRKLLDSKNVDAVTIATPNHWHALAAIWSIQHGKDVYVEKPVSHNVWEGRKIVEAARKYGRIVQTGTQSRSNPGLREAIQFLHDGQLGKIKLARGLCYKRRPSIGKVSGPQQPPASVDYDLWCGPAPKEPLMRTRLHYDWHWVWPTGNGDLGNQGIHQMDIARWALKVDHLSPKVFSVGGRLGYVDDGTTPNTQIVFHDYEDAPLIFEVQGLPSKTDSDKMGAYRGASIGVVVDCENGYMVIPTYNSAIAYDKAGKEIRKFEGSASHHENFIKAVLSRNYKDLNADIHEGHLSSALCHTGNISYQLGKERPAGEIREEIKADHDASESFGRMQEHLAANGIDLASTNVKLGPVLKMDVKKERFKGNKAADALLTRNYRAPYIIEDKV